MTISTGAVTERRELSFRTYDDILREAERLVAGPHRTAGNWTLGQILVHLALPMHRSIDGFGFSLPIPLRWVMPLFRRRFLTKGLPAGVPLRGGGAVFLPPEDVPSDRGLEELRGAIDRLRRDPTRHPSPIIGRLTLAQWEQFHCRHAELHLSFVHPEGR